MDDGALALNAVTLQYAGSGRRAFVVLASKEHATDMLPPSPKTLHPSSLLWLSGRCVRGRGGILGELQGEAPKACCTLSRDSISSARLPNFASKSKWMHRFRLYTDSSVASSWEISPA